jgi:3-methylcrotonyl-CoA carboxylase alpha subunit
VAAARAAGYENAGTIEFLLDGHGDQAPFYFLEMNTRLQVEHPITEAVTGVDLVHAQLAVAAGDALPWRQDELWQRGHAIECRIYAEDPRQQFLPQAGRIVACTIPIGPGVRVDAGVEAGDDIGVHYDPLIAKLVVHAASRPDALARARSAARRFVVLGVRTNVPLLGRVLAHPRFAIGDVDTSFVDVEREALMAVPPPGMALAAVAAAGWARTYRASAGGSAHAVDVDRASGADPWDTLQGRSS